MSDQTTSTIDPPRPTIRRKQLRLAVIFAALASLAVVGASYVFLVVLPPAREAANLMKCHKQLRAIGQAMMLYANENRWSFPPDLGQVMITQDITPSIFVCPSSMDTPARGADLKAIGADLLAGDHCSYVYVGNSSLRWPMPENLVVAYELPGHHPTGSHFLFGDLHVEIVSPATTEKMLAELKSGHNPPRAEKIR